MVLGHATAGAPARAQTAEETAALLWLAIEDGADVNGTEVSGDRARRVSRSPAIYDTFNVPRKVISGRITVTRRSACQYHFLHAPAKWVGDRFGDDAGRRSEWVVDFGRVTGIQAYTSEPDLFFFTVDGPPMCEDLGGGRICASSYPRPLSGPPIARAQEILAQFQKDICKPAK
ncbi:hypothetical protein AE618_08460 [Bosea vaviloviae]|uniref:Uncharacterized protein n=1 Tax=Bosea vaviloviae TaxID=1526658 RepID=A0A0N0MC48_9HYPH|nr:hypothetical protein AE618_08460 [Bosea vaviloviae]